MDDPTALLLPMAHVGHWTWTLFLFPVLIVLFSIVKTTLSERRKERDEDASSTRGQGPRP